MGDRQAYYTTYSKSKTRSLPGFLFSTTPPSAATLSAQNGSPPEADGAPFPLPVLPFSRCGSAGAPLEDSFGFFDIRQTRFCVQVIGPLA